MSWRSFARGAALLPLLFATAFSGCGYFPQTDAQRLDQATAQLRAAADEQSRFYALDAVAKESFNAEKFDDAERYAKELLTLAPKYAGDWNYGNAIQDGNLVLGRLALKNGRIDDAKQFLAAAGSSPGSPQMDTFGPNMSLAADLLDKGERQAVLDYFEACRKFWRHSETLDAWRDTVAAGHKPNFGPNLIF